MIEILSQYGVAGILVILILREVLPWVSKAKNGNGKSVVACCVSRSEFEEHKKNVQYKDNCKQIQQTINTRFDSLEKLHKAQKEYQEQRFDSMEQGLVEVKGLIKNGR